jgi:transposase
MSRISRFLSYFLITFFLLRMLLTFFFICLLVPQLTPALRERTCELHSAAQWGYRRIHQRYPWISLSTIRYTIKKEHERRSGVSKPRPGRPKKLNETDKVRLLNAVTENPRVTHEDLLAEKRKAQQLEFRLIEIYPTVDSFLLSSALRSERGMLNTGTRRGKGSISAEVSNR